MDVFLVLCETPETKHTLSASLLCTPPCWQVSKDLGHSQEAKAEWASTLILPDFHVFNHVSLQHYNTHTCTHVHTHSLFQWGKSVTPSLSNTKQHLSLPLCFSPPPFLLVNGTLRGFSLLFNTFQLWLLVRDNEKHTYCSCWVSSSLSLENFKTRVHCGVWRTGINHILTIHIFSHWTQPTYTWKTLRWEYVFLDEEWLS